MICWTSVHARACRYVCVWGGGGEGCRGPPAPCGGQADVTQSCQPARPWHCTHQTLTSRTSYAWCVAAAPKLLQVSQNHSMRDPKYVSISEPSYVQEKKDK